MNTFEIEDYGRFGDICERIAPTKLIAIKDHFSSIKDEIDDGETITLEIWEKPKVTIFRLDCKGKILSIDDITRE